MKNKIIIACGGTGGHIFPAIAISKELLSQKNNVYWIGSRVSNESKLVPKHQIKFFGILSIKVKGNKLSKLLFAPFILFLAFLQAFILIAFIRPRTIIGFGGYVSFPTIIAGWVYGARIIIHEQNSVIGLSNKVLSKFADVLLLTYPIKGVLSGVRKFVITGMPVRKEFITTKEQITNKYSFHDEIKLLIIGGSGGARIFNEAIPYVLAKLNFNFRGIEIVHQCGKGNALKVNELYKKLNLKNVTAVDFIDDVATVMHNSHIVISRAGSSAIAEITASGVYSILIPLKNSTDNHQYHNALALKESNAIKIILEDDLKQSLFDVLKNIDLNLCLKNALTLYDFGMNNTDSIKKIYNIIVDDKLWLQ